MSKTYNLFISHSWAYSDAYEKVITMLDKCDITYKNYSVPKDNPIHNAKNDKELYEAIKTQIKPTSIVIILAGVYSSYSKWIDKEIKISKDDFDKKIIAIEPWDSEKTSKKVKDNADRIVGWNYSSLEKAIKELS
ncbi:TIR domain-containing protein [Cetobacterium sp.]|uniref:TIR domain-containing protein n=1 Tax=Cetobacterium sp. TaxID=2071632 RepID=UPI003F3CA5D4